MEVLEQNELVKIVKESGLEKIKGQVLLDKFSDYIQIAAEWEAKTKALVITDVSQKAEMKMADEARKFLQEKRIDVEKTRVALKQDSLREGQAIDAIAKFITSLIVPLENDLKLKAKFAQIKEAEEKAALRDARFPILSQYTDASIYPLSEMSEEAFNDLVAGFKQAHEAKIEAQRLAEIERIRLKDWEALRWKRSDEIKPYYSFFKEDVSLADMPEAEFNDLLLNIKQQKQNHEAEQERIRIENDNLKEAADKREKEIAAERAKADAEKKEIEAKAQAERDEAAAVAKKIQEEADAIIKSERDARAKLEADLKAKADAELKAEQDKAAALEAELGMGDKGKFDALIKDLEAIQTKYTFKSKKYKVIQFSVNELLNKTINYAISK